MIVRLSDSNEDGLLGMEDFAKMMEGIKDKRNKESKIIEAFGMYEDMEASRKWVSICHTVLKSTSSLKCPTSSSLIGKPHVEEKCHTLAKEYNLI
ncbi:hypothetical protein BC332_28802 [Capsicum chinense]|nr:hypothetical protein BC332_28802 [Capsicum chinense]